MKARDATCEPSQVHERFRPYRAAHLTVPDIGLHFQVVYNLSSFSCHMLLTDYITIMHDLVAFTVTVPSVASSTTQII